MHFPTACNAIHNIGTIYRVEHENITWHSCSFSFFPEYGDCCRKATLVLLVFKEHWNSFIYCGTLKWGTGPNFIIGTQHFK